MVALYFGMMGASFAVGGLGGAVIANREVLVTIVVAYWVE